MFTTTHDAILIALAGFCLTAWITQLVVYRTNVQSAQRAQIDNPWVGTLIIILAVIW